MNKELNAVEKLKSCCLDLQFKRRDVVDIALDIEKYSKIIETALKKLNNIETTCIDLEQENQALYKENKKLKRALKVIKEKKVDVFILIDYISRDKELRFGALGTYNLLIDKSKQLTQEEFDLLKEVLL